MKLLLHFALCLCTALLRAQEPVQLISPEKPDVGWTFDNGREFKGATGSLLADPAAQREGRGSMKLVGDFTQGGNYVVAGRKIDRVEIGELSFWLRSPDTSQLTLRINDASGQTHQIDLKMEAQADWQHLVLPLAKFFAKQGQADAVTSIGRYETWGGAKDGKWHGPATGLYLLATRRGEGLVRTIWFNEVTITPPAPARTVTFTSGFAGGELPAGWQKTEGVSLDPKNLFKRDPALLLTRSLENLERPVSTTGPAFPVKPGQWEFSAACQSALNSADSSYQGVVSLECLDAGGKVIERITVAEQFGQRAWEPLKKSAELPVAVVSARFQVQLNKTWGEFRVAELSATYLSAPRQNDRVARVLFTTAQLGNLLLPEDPRIVQIAVNTLKPLPENARTISCEVRDYFGAEQSKPVPVTLGTVGGKGDATRYMGVLDLAAVPLEIGRYYEIHVAVPGEAGDEPFRAQTSFAILPEAETKKYKPEEIPFTSRTWDNRIAEYVRLTDRLGIRICGLWGGWSAKPPYMPEAPQIELVQKLGMGWLTNTPAAQIELGKGVHDETALRQGVRNLIEKYGAVRPMVINLGNEPHGKGDRVLKNVAAYRAIYEEVKKVDPAIPVVATSVEPNEEYFQAGYGQWCDAFDFHIYETHDAVRRTIGEYRELMKKYHCEKPIWSTELGLNSQGQTRLAVATSLTKKFATFFAAGGANASWFGLLYPDPEGKLIGTSGDSHNVFDCRYSHYAPRLDAVAYYHAVNAIAIKKFVEERQYANGVHAFLFRDRDGHSLQVVWSEKGRQDVALPLAAQEVQVIRVDGAHRTLQADGVDVTLSIGEEPLLLLYEGGGALAAELGTPAGTLAPLPKRVSRLMPVELVVATKMTSELLAPPHWQTARTATGFTALAPAGSVVREADFTVMLTDEQGRRRGELYARAPLE